MDSASILGLPSYAKALSHIKNFQTSAECVSLDSLKPALSRFIEIISDLAAEFVQLSQGFPPEIGARVKSFFSYNLIGGKMLRGLFLLKTFLSLSDPKRNPPPGFTAGPAARAPLGQLKAAFISAFCIELLHAVFLVADDIMDQSPTRRGKKCWYLVEEIRWTSVNDVCFCLSFINMLLSAFIEDQRVHREVYLIFANNQFITCCGQTMDTHMETECLAAIRRRDQEGEKINFRRLFTDENHRKIAVPKTAYYTLILPLETAHVVRGLLTERRKKSLKEFGEKMGYYFQSQDDFLDIYGPRKEVGKEGTDIQDGKCSWLAVRFLERASEEEYDVFQRNYCKKNEECVKAVQKLYDEKKVDQLFREWEEKFLIEVRDFVKQESLSDESLEEICEGVISVLQGRKK